MSRFTSPADRLIIAADFKPEQLDSKDWVQGKVLNLARTLQGTGVCLKMNSALRACGYDLGRRVRSFGLKIFADLKLYDIGETLATDARLLRGMGADLLTVSCAAGTDGIKVLVNELPQTEILGVTVLTSFNDAQSLAVFGQPISNAALQLAQIARDGGAHGLICSAKEVRGLRTQFGNRFSLNTPGIRPEWAPRPPGDDQNPLRVMTPAQAIRAGADRIVIGRPILQSPDPLEAVKRTLEEIESAFVPASEAPTK